MNLFKHFNMKKSIEIKNEIQVVHPTNKPLSEREIWVEIKKAEDGPFCTVQEGIKNFEQLSIFNVPRGTISF